MVAQTQQTSSDDVPVAVQLVPLETPDDDVGYALSLLKPILEATIQKLYELNKPGWGSYCELFYQTISDVMVSANEEVGK